MDVTPIVLAITLAQGAPSGAPDGAHSPALAEAPAHQDDAGVLLPLEVGRTGAVILSDGRAISGEVAELRRDEVYVLGEDGSTTRVPRSLARGVVQLTFPWGALEGRREVRVVTSGGQVLAGHAAVPRGDALVIAGAGGERSLPRDQVRAILAAREARRPIQPVQRHLDAPSAFMPEPGDLVLDWRDLTSTELTFGVAGLGAVTAGTVVPALRERRWGSNVHLGLRAGGPLLPWLRAAGGLHLDVARSGGASVAASATATVGTPRLHLTVHAGPAFSGANQLDGVGRIAYAAAATWQLTRRIDAIGEVWMSSRGGERGGIARAGARFHAWRVALDASAGSDFVRPGLRVWIAAALDLTYWGNP